MWNWVEARQGAAYVLAMKLSKVRTTLLLGTLLAAGCGGGSPSGPTPAPSEAAITLAANPNPIVGGACRGCGSTGTDREAVTSLTIRETAGVGGAVSSIAMSLRDAGTNAVIAAGEFDGAAVVALAGSSRVSAAGTLVVPSVGVHYPRDQAGRSATLTYTVRVTDDRGNTVSRDLAVPVSAT